MGFKIGFLRNLYTVVLLFSYSNCSFFICWGWGDILFPLFILLDFTHGMFIKRFANCVSFWPIFHSACRILIVPLLFSFRQLTFHVNNTRQFSYSVFSGKNRKTNFSFLQHLTSARYVRILVHMYLSHVTGDAEYACLNLCSLRKNLHKNYVLRWIRNTSCFSRFPGQWGPHVPA